jgi:hypothetical protein
MSRIETDAKPWLAPMMAGVAVSLNESAQRSIAAWAALKAIVGRYAHEPHFPVSPDWLDSFNSTHIPPSTWHIWAGIYDGIQSPFYGGGDVSLAIDGDRPKRRSAVRPEDEVVYMSLLVGKLALKVFGGRLALDAPISSNLLVRVWPTSPRSIVWPPLVTIGDSALRWFLWLLISGSFQDDAPPP